MCQEQTGQLNPEVIKAVGTFGGGIAGSGNVCGVLLAGVSAISSLYSRSSLAGKENPRMWAVSNTFLKKFTELTKIHGGTTCNDIARVNWHDHKEARNFYFAPDSRRHECIKLVGDAAFILGELLEEEMAREDTTS